MGREAAVHVQTCKSNGGKAEGSWDEGGLTKQEWAQLQLSLLKSVSI